MKTAKYNKLTLELPGLEDAGRLISNDYFNSFFPYLTVIDMEIRMNRSLSGIPGGCAMLVEYKAFIKNEVAVCTVAEIDRIEMCFSHIDEMLCQLGLSINPSSIAVIKTTGKEEGEHGYTRNHCIVIPQKYFAVKDDFQLLAFFTHELFHVISRYNPVLRANLYNLIGFENDETIFATQKFNTRRITNPDAANWRYRINLGSDKEQDWYAPVIYSAYEKYDAAVEHGMFGYIKTGYCKLGNENIADITNVEEILSINGHYEKYISGKQRATDEAYEHRLYDVISRNTGYIMHPEEILADNFSLLLLATQNPSLLDGIGPLGMQLQENIKAMIKEAK